MNYNEVKCNEVKCSEENMEGMKRCCGMVWCGVYGVEEKVKKVKSTKAKTKTEQ